MAPNRPAEKCPRGEPSGPLTIIAGIDYSSSTVWRIYSCHSLTLPLGARLGPYEILAAIGAGGMGEVYRATDTKLERRSRIKVLPEIVRARSGPAGAVPA